MKKMIIVFLLFKSMFIFAQDKTEKSIWKSYSEKVNNGYSIQFKYPTYFKFDRIENCMCLGRPAKSEEYNNTMDWGIWIDEPRNYSELDEAYLKKEFNNDYTIKKDTIMLSKHKALRTIVSQSHGEKYYELIVIKFKDCVFEIINKKAKSVDFKVFYDSIIITSIDGKM